MTGSTTQGAQDQPGGASASREESIWADLKHSRDPESCSTAWLELLSRRLGPVMLRGVVVLGAANSGPFAPVAVWPKGALGSPSLVTGIEKAIGQRKGVVEGGRKAHGDDDLHRKLDVIAQPLIVDDQVFGAVAIEIEHQPGPELAGVVEQLQWSMIALEAFIRRNRFTASDRMATVLDLIATSLHHDRFQASATAVATELAGLLQCERVSIGFMKGKHSRVRALSNSASFGKKANVIRAIEAAMDEAIDQQATVVYPPSGDGPLQVTRSHEALLRDFGSSTACSVPLAEGSRIIGAITLERPAGEAFDARTIQLCEHVAALIGPVLDVKRKDDRWLFQKALDSGKSYVRKLTGPRHSILKLVSAIVLFLVVFFTFATGDYRVTADARLEGSVQRAMAAPLAGYIAEANVRAGDIVREGDPLFSLDDRDLWLERLKWVSQKSQYSREYQEAVAGRGRAQANVLAAQIEQAEAQIALIEDQLGRVKVTAPFDAIVVAGDLSQSLGVPVERGDVLFELAPLDDYRVILMVDERDIGPLTPGQTGRLALTGLPGETLDIVVDRITPVASTEEGRNYFRVEASLADTSSAQLRPGMEGAGKVDVERRKLIWIWTHKIGYWLRMFFWSWWP
ncbi:MAG: HlyD family efflux transporter periplasmic adaptor subunit [Gammaproteobacteria bacterium]